MIPKPLIAELETNLEALAEKLCVSQTDMLYMVLLGNIIRDKETEEVDIDSIRLVIGLLHEIRPRVDYKLSTIDNNQKKKELEKELKEKLIPEYIKITNLIKEILPENNIYIMLKPTLTNTISPWQQYLPRPNPRPNPGEKPPTHNAPAPFYKLIRPQIEQARSTSRSLGIRRISSRASR